MSVILVQARKNCWQSWSIHNNDLEAKEQANSNASNKDTDLILDSEQVLLMAKAIKQHKKVTLQKV